MRIKGGFEGNAVMKIEMEMEIGIRDLGEVEIARDEALGIHRNCWTEKGGIRRSRSERRSGDRIGREQEREEVRL